jgi:transcription elongation factor Elf1
MGSTMRKSVRTSLFVIQILIIAVIMGNIPEYTDSPPALPSDMIDTVNTTPTNTPTITPTETPQEPVKPETEIIPKPPQQCPGCPENLVYYSYKMGDDRTMTITCPGCGTIFSFDYTMLRKYICPGCGHVVQDYVGIAVMDNGVLFVPLNTITSDLCQYGLETRMNRAIDDVRVGDRWVRTVTDCYLLETAHASLAWDEGNPDSVEINGTPRNLSGTPFREDIAHVSYYSTGPRYQNTSYSTRISNEDPPSPWDVGFGPGQRIQTVATRVNVLFVPLREFIEPLGFGVEMTTDTVTITSGTLSVA